MLKSQENHRKIDIKKMQKIIAQTDMMITAMSGNLF